MEILFLNFIYTDYRKPQPISGDIFCLDGGPISFRPRPGASIPNCLSAPGPVKRSNFISKTNITAMVEIRKFIVNRR